MNIQDQAEPVGCTNPVDAPVLADYWLALLPESEEEAVEEHLLGCDQCGEQLRQVIALVEGVRKLAREGTLRIVVSDEFLKRAAEEGLRVRQYAPPAGGKVECTVTDKDDILIGRLAANLSGADRVDLSFCDEHGVEQTRLRDIPVRDGAGEVVFQESMTLARALPTCTFIARLLEVQEAGAERLLGEYRFHHTRSIP